MFLISSIYLLLLPCPLSGSPGSGTGLGFPIALSVEGRIAQPFGRRVPDPLNHVTPILWVTPLVADSIGYGFLVSLAILSP